MWQLCFPIALILIALVAGHRRLTAMIAAVFVVAFACVSALMPQTYATGPGEWRSLPQVDGSVIKLGPRTKIELKYDEEQRLIRQRTGEATYQVAHDANRPFRVQCGATTVQAIGTKFGVSCNAQTSDVIVTEGEVSIFRRREGRDQDTPVDHVRAGAGYGVHVDQWTPLVPRPVDVVTALAWERQRIFFDGTPVEQAIGEFNRRNKRQIPIPSYDGENYRIFGEFDLGDPDGFAEHLERTMPRRGSK